MEDIVVEYLKSVSSLCSEYKALPSPIRKNHLGLSLELINKVQRIKGARVEERRISLRKAVDNMNICLQEKSNFIINFEAFVNHTSNFRYDTIHEVFSRVGIENISKNCLKDMEFVSILSQKHSIEGNTNYKVFVSLLISELDDLAQRRNEIAHGTRVDDIESIDIVISRINLIKAYGKAIDWVVMNSLAQFTFSVLPNISLGRAARLFPNLRVIGFEQVSSLKHSDATHKISEGDMLFAVNNNSSEKTISGKITSLRRDKKLEKTIEIPCEKPISIGVNFEIPGNFDKRSIYVVPRV